MAKQPSLNDPEKVGMLLPISSEEVAVAQRKSIIAGGITLALIGVSISCANMFTAWAVPLNIVTLLASMYLLLFWIFEGGDAFKLTKPLSGTACLRLQRLVDSHPEIAGLVAHVRESGRQVSWGDLWQANAWLHEQAIAEQERARRSLNGVAG